MMLLLNSCGRKVEIDWSATLVVIVNVLKAEYRTASLLHHILGLTIDDKHYTALQVIAQGTATRIHASYPLLIPKSLKEAGQCTASHKQLTFIGMNEGAKACK